MVRVRWAGVAFGLLQVLTYYLPYPPNLRALALGLVGVLAVDAPPLTASVDGVQVERLLENLLANAVKHTPAGTSMASDLFPGRRRSYHCRGRRPWGVRWTEGGHL